MTERKRLALRIILCVANVLVGDDLAEKEQEELDNIITSLKVSDL